MLTLQYIPFHEVELLSPDKRIMKLLNVVKKNKVVLMQGRLDPKEEAKLIEKTMEEVSKEFKGIELCTVYPSKARKKKDLANQIKQYLAKMLVGDREGFTIIGPATVIKEIKKNPDKIELLTHSRRRAGRK